MKHFDMDTNKLSLNINDAIKITVQIVVVAIAFYGLYASISSDIRSISEKIDNITNTQVADQDRVSENSAAIRDLERRVQTLENQMNFYVLEAR